MPLLNKPGYGSKLSNPKRLSKIVREFAIHDLVERFLDFYPVYRNGKNIAYIDVGSADTVKLENPWDFTIDHILYWMAQALDIEFTSGELFDAKEYIVDYASIHGARFEGDLSRDFEEDEA